jgi:hypothetical protein
MLAAEPFEMQLRQASAGEIEKFTCHYQLFNAALRDFLKVALEH